MFNTLDELFESYNETMRDLKEGHPIVGPIQYHLTGEGGGDWYLEINGVDIVAHKGVVENPVSEVTCPASDYLDLKNHKTTHSKLLSTNKMVVSKNITNMLRLSDYMYKAPKKEQ